MRHSRSGVARARCLCALLGVAFVLAGGGAFAETGSVGFAAQSFSGAGTKPTGASAESKLWWNDGSWWASMWSAAGDFHVFRLDPAAGRWLDSGVALDNRSGTRADVLWDGTHLYVASHSYAATPVAGIAARLYRYSYDRTTRTYSRDSGFPVAVNNYRTKSLVIDKDSTGAVWATWVQDNEVYVSHTLGDDRSWRTPLPLPVAGASGLASGDVCTLVAFDGRIGVLWRDGTDGTIRFAVHLDGQPDADWASEVALAGSRSAGDQLQLKADDSGRVFAAVGSSETDPAAAGALLLVRRANGSWDRHDFGTLADPHAQPIVLVDAHARLVRMFATSPEAGGTIYQKTAGLDAISFAPGPGTPFIRDAATLALQSATSTKQGLAGAPGFVVLASNARTGTYWFNEDVNPPPANLAPVLRDDEASGGEDAPLLAEVLANDAPGPQSEAGQTLAIDALPVPPAHGIAEVVGGRVRYVPSPDYNGSDSFVYSACDDGVPRLCSTAAVRVTIAAANDPPVAADDAAIAAEDGTVVVQPTANDVAGPDNELSQSLSLTRVLEPPQHGTIDLRAGREGVGELSYRPEPAFTGDDGLVYEVCDDGASAGSPDPLCSSARVTLTVRRIVAAAETEPMPSAGPAADDVAIWANPSDPSLSAIIGTNKAIGGGLAVYDLGGRQLQYVRDGKMNNVDLRDGFPLREAEVTLVAASDRDTAGGARPNGAIAVFRLDPGTRTLEDVAARVIEPGVPAYGLCMYRSRTSGRFYVFVDGKSGGVEQWELLDAGDGHVDATRVRSFAVGATTEACAADDERGFLYVGAKDVGIWRYSAEPDGGTARFLVDAVEPSGHIAPDIEGLAIAHGPGGRGYLFASNHGDASFTTYRLTGTNAFVGRFSIKESAIDGVEAPEGIDATMADLGPAFPRGAFVSQDAANGTENQNYKLVPLDEIVRTDEAPAPSAPCTRPYADDSPWNALIGPAPEYEPQGDQRIAQLQGRLSSDPTQYTYPVYIVSPAIAPTTVTLSGWYSNVLDATTLVNQRGGTVALPLPPGAQAAAGGDAQIVLLNPATGDEWGASRLERLADGTWHAWNAYHYNTRWTAVPPYDTSGDPFFPRGAGIPYLAGLVRPCEIARGRIDHALAFAYDFPTHEYVYPATKSDGNSTDPLDLPEGARLQLDPTLSDDDIRAWGCDGACLTIARALQRYGMYVVDNSGRPKIVVEYEGTAGWDGLIDSHTIEAIPLSAFRLLRLPP
jgi:myo-inositol-hexaphosphate 3-phosphohydrolase